MREKKNINREKVVLFTRGHDDHHCHPDSGYLGFRIFRARSLNQSGYSWNYYIIPCFILLWKALGERRPVRATWLGILSGMITWMVVGEISHHFGFVEIEAETGMVLLVFMTVVTLMLWAKKFYHGDSKCILLRFT